MLESVLAESEEGCVKNRSFERERLSGANLSEAEFDRCGSKSACSRVSFFVLGLLRGGVRELYFFGMQLFRRVFQGCNFSVCKGDGLQFFGKSF